MENEEEFIPCSRYPVLVRESLWSRLGRRFWGKTAFKTSETTMPVDYQWPPYSKPGSVESPKDEDFAIGLENSGFCSYCQAVVDRLGEVKRRHLSRKQPKAIMSLVLVRASSILIAKRLWRHRQLPAARSVLALPSH
jgi:hypothetical protein